MAFYQNETSIANMDIQWVGFDPDSDEATIHLERVIQSEDFDNTVWIQQKIRVPYELLRAMFLEVASLKEDMAEAGQTEYDLRKPSLTIA